MKNIQKGIWQHLLVVILIFVVASITLYPLFDFGYAHLITHSPFVYNVVDHVVTPASISVLLGLIFWAIDRPKKDNTDEK